MKELKLETIIVPKESLFYLRQLSRRERLCNELSEESLQKYWKSILKFNSVNDKEVRIDEHDFSKSVVELKKLLNDANLKYREDGVKTDCIII